MSPPLTLTSERSQRSLVRLRSRDLRRGNAWTNERLSILSLGFDTARASTDSWAFSAVPRDWSAWCCVAVHKVDLSGCTPESALTCQLSTICPSRTTQRDKHRFLQRSAVMPVLSQCVRECHERIQLCQRIDSCLFNLHRAMREKP